MMLGSIVSRNWPDWMSRLQVEPGQLPTVMAPGPVIGRIDAGLAGRWGWPTGVEVVAGTTDSTAGFIATGATATPAGKRYPLALTQEHHAMYGRALAREIRLLQDETVQVTLPDTARSLRALQDAVAQRDRSPRES